jgi:hypothetical protein
MNKEHEILSDIVVWMKYAKFIPELNRRETWEELVTRNMNMHIAKFPHLEDVIKLTIGLCTRRRYCHLCARYSSVAVRLR